ncbi:hypothetical protein [Streptomyces nojiriensis]
MEPTNTPPSGPVTGSGPGPRESKKPRTRRHPAVTALELFLERGFDVI